MTTDDASPESPAAAPAQAKQSTKKRGRWWAILVLLAGIAVGSAGALGVTALSDTERQQTDATAIAGAQSLTQEKLYAAHLKLANSAWAAGRKWEAWEYLDTTPWNMHSWEHSHLRGKFSFGRGHASTITAVCYSSDGKQIASGDQDSSIRIWDSATGVAQTAFSVKKLTSVSDIAFSPDGSRVAAVDGHRMAVINAATGDEVFSLTLGSPHELQFSPDGKWILTNSDSRFRPSVFNAETGSKIWDLGIESEGSSSARFRPDGKQIVTGGRDGVLRIWSTADRQVVREIKAHENRIYNVAWSRDGKWLASSDDTPAIKIWKLGNEKEHAVLNGHTSMVKCLEFSPDGRVIVSVGRDDAVKFWAVDSGELLATPPEYSSVNDVMFSPASDHIVSGGVYRVVRVRKAVRPPHGNTVTDRFGQEFVVSQGVDPHDLNCVAVWPDSRQFATGGADGKVRIWDSASGAEVATLTGGESPISSVGVSDTGMIIGGDLEGSVKIWDSSTGRLIRSIAAFTRGVRRTCLSSDGRLAAAVGGDRHPGQVWNVKSGELVSALDCDDGDLTTIVFNADGSQLVTGNNARQVRVWDVTTGKALTTVSKRTEQNSLRRTGINAVTFSRDGKFFAAGGGDTSIQVWETESGREHVALYGHSGTVDSLSFSPDGKRIVSSDGNVWLWDSKTGVRVLELGAASRQIAMSADGRCIVGVSRRGWQIWRGSYEKPKAFVARGHSGAVLCVRFSEDGTRFVSGGTDRIVRLWETHTGLCVRKLHGHSGDVTAVAFSPDDRHIVSGSLDNTIRIWNAKSGEPLHVVKEAHRVNQLAHKSGVTSLDYSHDGKRIISGGHDYRIRIRNAETGDEESAHIGQESCAIRAVRFAPDGLSFVSAGEFGRPILWKNGNRQEFADPTRDLTEVDFSPDGSRVVSAGFAGLQLWDVSTGREIKTAGGAAHCVRFSRGGKLIARGHNSDVAVCDASGKFLLSLGKHEGSATSVDFHPDGERVISSGSDGTVRVWHLPATIQAELTD